MQPLIYNAVVVLIGIGLMVGLYLIVSGLREPNMPKVRPKPFMTQSELGLWRDLQDAAAPLRVAQQVAMSALVQPDEDLEKSEFRAVANTIAGKVLDFVLFDDLGRVRLIVEWEDDLPRNGKSIRRDGMLAHAGYRALRLQRSRPLDATALRRLIAETIGAVPLTEPAPASPRMVFPGALPSTA